ncbi:M17 family metallopeptidase [Actibacterium sp. 188UL27-1]|uniref:leucyl aminopeptidase family protein n=1 Tax=Actibacterium sp. 188UL27-1 TaxID=2786961 RepID=UPI001956AECF|nr:leucyl aminopeptidase family protein [Actibacterium sp. 188UL27-1]MBM7067150.1 leucyl aminopeptidase family protein [Actibacterium sp. 188UL27-1]
MTLSFAPGDADAIPLHVLSESDWTDWCAAHEGQTRDWLEQLGFSGALGQVMLAPDSGGAQAFVGYGSTATRRRGRFNGADAAARLPKGTYRLVTELPDHERDAFALGWLLTGYRFDRYKSQPSNSATLQVPNGIDGDRLATIANGEALTRDLINTPAADMGPADLARAAADLADRFDASCTVTEGAALLEANLPMIHAVGRAAAQPPRLIDMRWGSDGPSLTLVGKGVCFDTGGLNLKPGSSMGLMKKDMGGAAAVLGLTQMIMALDLPLRLRVLIPAVENSVSSNAFRPQDILTSRKGLTVEVNNTDAEGRLVLADALSLADEEAPDLLISMATLTGAARVAVGPDLAPFYTDDEMVAAALAQAGTAVADPVWRLPFWDPYEAMIEPGIADLDNAPKGGFAGSITAALFLRRFVSAERRYIHFDMYGWQPVAAPARPKGGVGQGTRAVLDALPQVLGL